MKRYKVEVFEDVLGTWRWRLVASNGRIVATSGEGYVKRSHAEKMVDSIFRNASHISG